MDIDVDVGRGDVKIEQVWGLCAVDQESVVGRDHRLMEIGVLHEAAIDEKILVGSLLACSLWLPDITADTAHGGRDLYGQQVLGKTLAEDIGNALKERAGVQVEQFGVVAVQGKGDIGIDQDDTLEGR